MTSFLFYMFWKKNFEIFFENLLWKFFLWLFQMSNFFPNLSSFLVYTGCGSGIRCYKFHFCTLYIPKKLSQVYLKWNIDVAFSKYQKSTTKQKFKISKKYVATDSALVEACREVGCCISIGRFPIAKRTKIRYLIICCYLNFTS